MFRTQVCFSCASWTVGLGRSLLLSLLRCLSLPHWLLAGPIFFGQTCENLDGGKPPFQTARLADAKFLASRLSLDESGGKPPFQTVHSLHDYSPWPHLIRRKQSSKREGCRTLNY